MSSTFAQPVNTFKTTLASGHTSADGHLVLALSPGVLDSGRLWRVTALQNPDTVSEVVLAIFEATSSSGVTLSDVAAAEGYADLNLASGTPVQIRMTAKDLSEVQAAVNTAETSIATNTAAITTIQTNQAADEVTLAAHTTELASHATTLTADGTAITSLQSSRTTDEATLAAHTTELASHASTLTADATELAAHATALTADAAAITALQAIAPINLQCSGDSITAGFGLSSPSTQSWPAQMGAILGAQWSVVNDGISGDTIAQCATAALTTVDPAWSPRAPLNISFLFAGTNDSYYDLIASMTNDQIVAAIQADTLAFHAARHTAGYPTVDCTMLPRTISNGNWEIIRQRINTWKRAIWTTYTDDLCDFALIASMGFPGDDTNLTLYQDGAHPTAAGAALLAAVAAASALRIANGAYARLAGPNTFTGVVTSPAFETTGAGSGYYVTRRDNSVPAFLVYSAAGAFQLYSFAASSDVLTSDASGNVTVTSITGSGAGLTGIPESGVTGLVAALALLAPLASPTFTGTVTAPSLTTTGAGAGIIVTRRDNSAAAFQFYSAAGTLSLYSYAASGPVLAIDGAGNIAAVAFAGSGAGLTGIPESGVTSLTSDLAAKAPIAAPTFTGTVTFAGGSAIDTNGYGFIEKMTFLLGQGQTLTNGTYPAGTVGVFASDAGKVWKWKLRAGTNPAGGAGGFSFDIQKNGTTILSAPIAVAANTTTLQTGNTFSTSTVAEGDEFTVTISSAGTGVQNVTLIVYSLVRNA